MRIDQSNNTIMLDDKIIKALQLKLRGLKDELLKLADTADDMAKTVELDQSRVGRLSRMDAMAGQAMSQESRRRREIQLRQIERALAKIEQRSYGECEECLEPINPQRLELNPAAPLCILCASAAEN